MRKATGSPKTECLTSYLASQVYEPGIAPGEVVRDVPASDSWVNHTIRKYINVGQNPNVTREVIRYENSVVIIPV